MTKSRRRPTRRTAKTTAKTTKTRTTKRRTFRKPLLSRRPKLIRLKPIYMQLGQTIGRLQKLPQTDQVTLAIQRLTTCQAAFEDICGTTMDIPAPPPPND